MDTTTSSSPELSSSDGNGIPVSPSLVPTIDSIELPVETPVLTARAVIICALAAGIGLASGFIARVLMGLIGLFTNFFFYQKFSFDSVSPAGHTMGPWVIVIPVIGGVIVGFMARYGSAGIRGHGIPEAMENVLTKKSRIPPRLTFLKPLSAAVSIGTGGPFGAEGPIIATGGALGSLVGQVLQTTAQERKTLLAAGAAAGMAATFGSPVSAVILAVELLLFELRPGSLIPVALAAVAATGVRVALVGADPVFPMAGVTEPGGGALASYVLIGLVVGLASVVVTRVVYGIEDLFDRLPIHWMWWPALGGIAVGVVGYFSPQTFGVGYDNIEHILSGSAGLRVLLVLCVMKFISWSVSLGSGTSGGTLAPLFTVGGALGGVLGFAGAALFPALGIDPRIAALVGMAAMFSGASHAFLASVVFAFETTLQPVGLLPLLGGCAAAYFVSLVLMKHSIMTEKISRRGIRVPREYAADFLDRLPVKDFASRATVTLKADDNIGTVRSWMDSGAEGSTHQGFPVLDGNDRLIGVVTRRDIQDAGVTGDRPLHSIIKRPPAAVYEDCSLREATDHMVRHNVGRLPVISRAVPHRLVGIITRGDILSAHQHRLDETSSPEPGMLSGILSRMRRGRSERDTTETADEDQRR